MCWTTLTRYFDDEHLEVDNLISERALRGGVIGRRDLFHH